MPVLRSRLHTNAPDFAANVAYMSGLLKEIRDLEVKVRQASSSKRTKFDKRGQILPRQRVARLLDPGTPFIELSTLAGLAMHDDDGKRTVMGGGSITGIGTVAGKRVAILASDSAIKGGAISPMGFKKTLRMQEIARQHKLPLVYMVESAGANLMYQGEIFVPGGRGFANQARMSAAGIPQVAIVHGSSTAGGAYLPGLSDYVVLVRGRSKIFLAGPPLVKAAMGEDADDESLGGAEMHATVTGLGEYMAEDDLHAIEVARDVLDKLRWDEAQSIADCQPPQFSADELMGIVPADPRTPYDAREIIARLVDNSDFLGFKDRYGVEMVCGHARIEGQLVGILANNGAIQPAGSTKAAHFIQACEQSGTPLIFLQNTTGYMVGTVAERGGAIKHGAKMIQAVANATVPKLTVVVGGSFGAGNYGMCGRGFDPNFLFSWPTARCAVMGGAQAAGVMEIITVAKMQRQGSTVDPSLVKGAFDMMKDQLDGEAHVLFNTARLFDDGVIDPRHTRALLGTCLRMAAEADQRTLRPSTFGVARP